MHWLFYVVVAVLVGLCWLGTPIDFPNRKRKTLYPRIEELERHEDSLPEV